MATIIEAITTGDRYVLLGAGYGMFASKSDPLLRNNKGSLKVVYGCDKYGEIHAIKSDMVKVITIDGKLPNELLDER